jgi:dienelactone hydrolase
MHSNVSVGMKFSICFVLIGIIGLLTTTCFSQELITDFKAGPEKGSFSFQSNSPQTMPELLRPGKSDTPVNIVGTMFMPKGTEKVPAVLLMHGSGGIHSAMLDYWPKLLNGQNIAVFTVDRFGPRGVKSTAEDQSEVPFAADVADAFAALRLLASHPRIDANHIAIMGFSRGALASWRTAAERIIKAQQLPDGLRFAAHVQMYSGGCAGILRLIVKPGTFSRSPQLWIHGESDDYTPIGPCRDYAKQIGEAGTPVEFVSLPGTYHKFDDINQRKAFHRNLQRTMESCPLEFDLDNLGTYDRTKGTKLTGVALAKAVKDCGAIGATLEGNVMSRDKAGQAVITFFRKVFNL